MKNLIFSLCICAGILPQVLIIPTPKERTQKLCTILKNNMSETTWAELLKKYTYHELLDGFSHCEQVNFVDKDKKTLFLKRGHPLVKNMIGDAWFLFHHFIDRERTLDEKKTMQEGDLFDASKQEHANLLQYALDVLVLTRELFPTQPVQPQPSSYPDLNLIDFSHVAISGGKKHKLSRPLAYLTAPLLILPFCLYIGYFTAEEGKESAFHHTFFPNTKKLQGRYQEEQHGWQLYNEHSATLKNNCLITHKNKDFLAFFENYFLAKPTHTVFTPKEQDMALNPEKPTKPTETEILELQ